MHFPRTGSKNKIPVDVGSGDVARFYNRKFGKIKKYDRIDISRVCKKFNNHIMHRIIYHSYEFTIPFNLGTIFIKTNRLRFDLDEDGKLIKKHMVPNWASTKELWAEDDDARQKKIIVYHFNDHFDRRVATYIYSKKKYRFKNKGIYFFKPSRMWKEELAKAIKNEDIDVNYVE